VSSPYPAAFLIHPSGPVVGNVRVPGSKSLTNRALVCAALAAGDSRLRGALTSEDTQVMQKALSQLGVTIAGGGESLRVSGRGGSLGSPGEALDARASGTTARFLTAAATLAAGPVVIDGSPRMRERPIDDLVTTLRALGADLEILGQHGCPPVRVTGGGLRGGHASIRTDRSSQFVSAVLLAAPCARESVTLVPAGPVVSRPYIDLTLQVMTHFGAQAGWREAGTLWVNPGGYRGCDYRVEPDASAATYPFAAAAIGGGRVRVPHLSADSRQGDVRFVDLLEAMGCRVERDRDGIAVSGTETLRGVDVDMNAMPDAVLTAAVVALFATGATRIRNVANLRIKESDRLAALERELRKLGAGAEASADALTIEPPRVEALHGAAIDTYDDHRMAMAFALAGLRVPGIVIRDPGCVAKTWPGYFDAMEFLAAEPA